MLRKYLLFWVFVPLELLTHLLSTIAIFAVVLIRFSILLIRYTLSRRKPERPLHHILLSGLGVTGSFFWMMFPLRNLRLRLQHV